MKKKQMHGFSEKHDFVDHPSMDLIGGYKAPTHFYRSVEQQIQDALNEVKPEKLYTLRMLCGEEFWSILGSNFCRRLAGRCFAHMVDQGHFPFEFIQYKRSPTKRYLLK